eukprot:TRINITY_DN14487_c0_g1_i3.p1 TRINITY_DN14487_c0_g1~~TRINITY_DN14487_c0_g1_i3.p1  ORF type:complete len:592 (-),score=68.30 TRINITY_DN14487_c0_g1_i3:59-1834(-)
MSTRITFFVMRVRRQAETEKAEEDKGFEKSGLAEDRDSDRVLKSLRSYYLDAFTIRVTGSEERERLFRDSGEANTRALRVFFQKHFSRSAVMTYCSFAHLRDTSWIDGDLKPLVPALGNEIQKGQSFHATIALLRQSANLGLDSEWATPAYAFTRKFIGPDASEPCSPEEALNFFVRLERLSSFIIFAGTRHRRSRYSPRRASGIQLNLNDPEDVQLEYIHEVQKSYYRELLVRIGQKLAVDPPGLLPVYARRNNAAPDSHVESVLQWMQLTEEEESFFKDRFPDAFPKKTYEKRATYALLKAESAGPCKAVVARGLVEELPLCLEKKRGRQAVQYRRALLDYVVSIQDSTMHSSTSSSRYEWKPSDRNSLCETLGNYVVLVPENVAEQRAGLDWVEVQQKLQKQPLALTNEIAQLEEFTPTYCRGRDKEIRRRLSLAWGPKFRDLPLTSVRSDLTNRHSRADSRGAESGRSGISVSMDYADCPVRSIKQFLSQCGGWAHCSVIGGRFAVKKYVLEKYFVVDGDGFVSYEERSLKRKRPAPEPRGSVCFASQDALWDLRGASRESRNLFDVPPQSEEAKRRRARQIRFERS